MSISFQNTEFKNSFGDLIATHHLGVLAAISERDLAQAEGHLAEIIGLLATARLCVRNATHDIRAVENLQVLLENRIREMPSGRSSAASASPVAATISPSGMKDLPPVGIIRNPREQYCGDITIGQFLVGAERIASKLAESDLGGLIRKIKVAQASGKPVDSSFGEAMRRYFGGKSDSSEPIDVLEPLHQILEKADVGFYLTPVTVLKDGITRLPEGRDEEVEKERYVSLQLSTKERNFTKLFELPFNLPSAEGSPLLRHSQFKETPEDLIVEVQRFKRVGTIRTKVNDPLQEVPQRFALDPKFTQSGSSDEYRLSGCILHNGKTLDDGDGHYIFLRRVGDTWYHIDDASVTRVEDPSALIAQAYVYHFEKIAAPSSSAEVSRGEPGPIAIRQKSLSETCLEYTIWAIGSLASLLFNVIKIPAQQINIALRAKKDS